MQEGQVQTGKMQGKEALSIKVRGEQKAKAWPGPARWHMPSLWCSKSEWALTWV